MIDVEHPPELFVSFDIETLGPIPGKHSMLSLGCAALTAEGELVSKFYATLLELPGTEADPDTVQWWAGQLEAWAQARLNARDPKTVIIEYVAWLKDLMSRYTVTLVAYPSGFDFTFLYWYTQTFCGESPVAHKCIDLRSFIMGMTGRPFDRTGMKHWPKRWKPAQELSHNAFDDALDQGMAFIKVLTQARRLTT